MSIKDNVEKVEMIWELNTLDLGVADLMMKKMLKVLDVSELSMIDDCKITKTVAEISINARE